MRVALVAFSTYRGARQPTSAEPQADPEIQAFDGLTAKQPVLTLRDGNFPPARVAYDGIVYACTGLIAKALKKVEWV